LEKEKKWNTVGLKISQLVGRDVVVGFGDLD